MALRTPSHPIRVVARRTGLSAEVIRAWEARYGVVEPARSDSGRRLYSDADVERLTLLRQALQGGRSIGQIAALPNKELRRLVADDLSAAPVAAAAVGAGGAVGQALQALQRMDAPQLEAVLRAASLGMSVGQFVDGVLTPLMREIGDEWRVGRLGIAHEHLASAIVRSVIAGLPRPSAPSSAAPHLVVATPSSQRHELGAMVVAAAALADGWRVTYLGADMPAGDIAAAVRQSGARTLALSLTYPLDDARLPEELAALRQALPEIRILAGGQAVGAYRHALTGIGAFVMENATSLRSTLEQLRLGAA